MSQQAAILSGSFSGIPTQRTRPMRGEALDQERRSLSRSLDLLDPVGQQIHQQDWQEPSPQQAQGSLTELIDKRQGMSQSARAHISAGRRAFLRLVVGELSENSKHIVGENGARRFEEFKRYRAGWDYGQGKSLSPRSLTTLELFLRQMPELAPIEPSLFLTHEGNLQLGWENADGNEVEVEFFPDKVEYYIEALGEEGTIELEVLYKLIDKVRTAIS